ncbi:hypothetical protein FLA105534_03095 [Flavobacterium bizetiae]|uniref:Uncharacterized protein n=1 Tax=Flavobacterium bizetiae TaxID=2704140 RepID=A0A6J4GQ99_9FLAO|nr:hypothetical protein [Flavobacterium bizetiae]CAA9200448.1 hypothetical protein FLA105534_03095 [Flavobacterium bizetiae]CAD5340602.1 hypothetical protein FLA105535_00557 [Flavobacterium bizetiae]CAD5346726.1 hypothetical protein FLA105534_00669 [Flavobacterium bizetiae]
MSRLRSFNLISQKFVAKYDDIPFIQTTHQSDLKYHVAVDVFNTDYMTSFFRTFDVSDLYAIYILNEENLYYYSDFNIISRHNFYGATIMIVKAESGFFKSIEYNNQSELATSFFFRTDAFETLKTEEILSKSLYEKEISAGSFRKTIVACDLLKLLDNIDINSVMKFYTHRTEASIEKALKLNDFILDENEDFISTIEISSFQQNK